MFQDINDALFSSAIKKTSNSTLLQAWQTQPICPRTGCPNSTKPAGNGSTSIDSFRMKNCAALTSRRHMIVWTSKLLVQNCTSPHGGCGMDNCTHAANHVQSVSKATITAEKYTPANFTCGKPETQYVRPLLPSKSPRLERER